MKKKGGFTLIETLGYVFSLLLLISIFISFLIFTLKFYSSEENYVFNLSELDKEVIRIKKEANNSTYLSCNDNIIKLEANGKQSYILYNADKKEIWHKREGTTNRAAREVKNFTAVEKGKIIIINMEGENGKKRSLCIRKKEEML